jgi:folate-dependent phosphoribosylglycinamide formyltransferase PurN
MKTIQLALSAVLLAASGAGMAAQATTDTTRDERMDQALQDYRSTHPDSNVGSESSQPGVATRVENSVKRGAHRTGEAIKHGAAKADHAIRSGVHKTGEAVHHVGEKMEGAKSDSQ